MTTVLWTTADTTESENQVLDLLSLVERIQSLFNLSENNLERQKNQIYQFLKTNTALLVIDSWDNLKVKDRYENFPRECNGYLYNFFPPFF